MSLKLKKTGLKGILFNTTQPMVLEFLTTSSNESIQIPLAGSVDVRVDWGDGFIEPVFSPYPEHEYANPGTYIVRVTGSADTLGGTSSPSALWTNTIQNVYSFGDLNFTSFFAAFKNVNSNVKMPSDIPSSVTIADSMFSNASSFNQNISSWKFGNIKNTFAMFFSATNFNQNIGNWDTNSLENAGQMFRNADAFDQDISNWDFGSLDSSDSLDDFMLDADGLYSDNYDALLVAWGDAADATTIFSPLSPNMGGSKYFSYDAQNARNKLIDTYSWTITDGGFDLDRISALLDESGDALVTEENQYIELEI